MSSPKEIKTEIAELKFDVKKKLPLVLKKPKNNYKNGKIYKITSDQTDQIYIGSSVQTLKRRFADHKSSYKNYNGNKYMTSFEILKYENCQIELLEEFPCNNRTELHRKEGEWQKKLNCVNKYISGRTDAEYCQDNKKNKNKYNKKYYQENQEKIKKNNTKYYQENQEDVKQRQYEKEDCEICGATLAHNGMLRHKKTAKCRSFKRLQLLSD